MKMPRDIELKRHSPTQDLVQFTTRCGRVSGSAYYASGHHETHYDIVEAKRLNAALDSGRPVAFSMLQRDVGCFDVLGQVIFIFEDGLFAVESCGFDFWVDPDQVDSPDEKKGSGLFNRYTYSPTQKRDLTPFSRPQIDLDLVDLLESLFEK